MGTTPRQGTSGGGLGMFKAPPAGAPKGPPANPRGSMGRPTPGGAPAGPAMAPVNGLQSRTTPPPRPAAPPPMPQYPTDMSQLPATGGWMRPAPIPGQPQGSGLNWTVPPPPRNDLAMLMAMFGMGGRDRYRGAQSGGSRGASSGYGGSATGGPGGFGGSSARGGRAY